MVKTKEVEKMMEIRRIGLQFPLCFWCWCWSHMIHVLPLLIFQLSLPGAKKHHYFEYVYLECANGKCDAYIPNNLRSNPWALGSVLDGMHLLWKCFILMLVVSEVICVDLRCLLHCAVFCVSFLVCSCETVVHWGDAVVDCHSCVFIAVSLFLLSPESTCGGRIQFIWKPLRSLETFLFVTLFKWYLTTLYFYYILRHTCIRHNETNKSVNEEELQSIYSFSDMWKIC